MYGRKPSLISMSDGCSQVFKYLKINVTSLLGDEPSDVETSWRGIPVKEDDSHKGIQLIGEE